MSGDTRNDIMESALKLLEENKPNLDDPSDKYAQGYNDGLLDILRRLSIPIPSGYKYYD